MTDTISSDSVAQDQIQSFFDRWHRLESEKQAISDDLKEMFAEMKGNGFDTKVARKLFRDMTTDQTVKSEFDALYDLYHAALTAPRAGRAREEGKVTTSNTAIPEGFDPETGEEITTNTGMVPATTADLAPATPAVVPNSAAPEPPSPAADAEEEVSGPTASSAPIQPETANQSTAARKDVRDNSTEATERAPAYDPAAAITSQAGTQAPPVDTLPGEELNDQDREAAALARRVFPHLSDEVPGDDDAEPANEADALTEANAGGTDARSLNDRAGEASAVSPAPTARLSHNPETHFLNSKGLVRLHGCLDPEICPSKSPRNALCFKCSTRHDGPTYQPTEEQRESVH